MKKIVLLFALGVSTFVFSQKKDKVLVSIDGENTTVSEFKRVYGLSAQYPDIAFSVLSSSFSQALFNNRSSVNILDVYNAIKTSKRIYPDSIIKELVIFKEKHKKLIEAENVVLPVVTLEEIQDLEND